MGLIQVVTRERDIDEDSIKRMTDGLDALIEKDHDDGVYVTDVEEPKKKRGRPRKSDKVEMVHVNSDREMSMMETNQPYITTYADTTQQLKNTINGIDMMASQIEHDLQMVRASRTLKKKYDYICELTSAAGSLVNNRISALREINSAITNAHRLDQARMKQNKEIAGVDDDKAIMDMYNAFVNTPVGTMQALPPGFSIPASALNGPNGLAINRNGMTEDQMYDNFVQNPSPEMSAIRMEMNPNIKTVVVYNQETQEKYFDIVDVSTGQSVPGIERPSDRLLARMDINLRDGIARNIDANLSYDLVIVGNRRIDEY